MAVAPALRATFSNLVADGKSRLVVDMTDVDSIDSAALGALVSGLKAARGAGGDLRIVAPSMQVLTVLGVDQPEAGATAVPSTGDAYRPHD